MVVWTVTGRNKVWNQTYLHKLTKGCCGRTEDDWSTILPLHHCSKNSQRYGHKVSNNCPQRKSRRYP